MWAYSQNEPQDTVCAHMHDWCAVIPLEMHFGESFQIRKNKSSEFLEMKMLLEKRFRCIIIGIITIHN